MDISVPQLTIIVGYYGVGKTNLALNLARRTARKNAQPVTLVDLDIVNPYFRSSDYQQQLQASGIKLLAPTFARSTQDTPSLPAAISGAFSTPGTVIVDVGGDDAGATALARYRADIERRTRQGTVLCPEEAGEGVHTPADPATPDFAFWYVVNRFRSNAPDTQTAAAEAVAQLRDIEAACHLKATGIINNTHLQSETTLATIQEGLAFGKTVAEMGALPLIATTIPEPLLSEARKTPPLKALYNTGKLWPVDLLVTTPWQTAPAWNVSP